MPLAPFKKTLTIPIYGPPLRLIVMVAPHLKDLEKEICGENGEDDSFGAFTNLKWPNCHIVFRDSDVDHNAIAHEADHATHKILREVGISESNDSEEAYTYLLGWITEAIYGVLHKAKIKVNLRRPNT